LQQQHQKQQQKQLWQQQFMFHFSLSFIKPKTRNVALANKRERDSDRDRERVMSPGKKPQKVFRKSDVATTLYFLLFGLLWQMQKRSKRIHNKCCPNCATGRDRENCFVWWHEKQVP